MTEDKIYKNIYMCVDVVMTFLAPLMCQLIWNWYAVHFFKLPAVTYEFMLLLTVMLDLFRSWLITFSVIEFKARFEESEEAKCKRRTASAMYFIFMFVILFLIQV